MDDLNLHSLADANHEPAHELPSMHGAPPQAAAAPNAFAQMGLAKELLAAVHDLNFTQPTEVQLRAIPLALQDNADKPANDLLVSSQTGSGKTAAFLLPVLHTILVERQAVEQEEAKAWALKVEQAKANGEELPKKPRRKNPTDVRHVKPAFPSALVLCPTRELAQQVAKDAIDLVKHCKGLRVACVVGGMPYPLQIARLHNADLVVATPGRLLDLQRSKQLHLSKVQFLVVDEADRMLDLGFAEDLADIHKLTESRRQTMMFSAT
ncbi:MAG: DEAD/DEAH box helicase, partial [Burkholderiales bacterium]